MAITAAPTAILVSFQSPINHPDETRASLRELEHLVNGLGIHVHATLSQRRTDPRGSFALGSGKLEELRQLIDERRSLSGAEPMLVFDGPLSPGQQRQLVRELGVEVLDRTQVILRVFKERARTRTAQLEIELAELHYELPRVRDDLSLGSKQGGGGGRGEKGHSNVELRKQQLKKRVASLQDELEALASLKLTRQARREQVSRVALVGYTNAGKSSWMRALTGADVLVKDALFATLDTTVRALHPPAVPPIVIADTVGFMRNLPNELLASFQSTLAEALDAELLLVLVDAADPLWRSQLDTTHDVLRRVHADAIPRLTLLNKADRIAETDRHEIRAELPDAHFVSVLHPDDVAQVRTEIARCFAGALVETELVVPFDLGALRAEIWRQGRVLTEHCDTEGARLRVRAQKSDLVRWQQVLAGLRE